MPRKKIIQMFLGLVLIAVLGIGGILRSGSIENPAHWGETMGTSYSVKISGKVKQADLKNLYSRIQSELAEINRQMSTWDSESEISRFNHSSSTNPFSCSKAFGSVVRRALELSDSTDGAFDPTLQPLLNIWGFGSEAEEQRIPSDTEIETARKLTGWEKVRIDKSSNLRKTEPELSLALGAIAKGYGVDVLARILDESGYENWFVEIGGEVVAKGFNPAGVPWKIGIQHPTTNPMDERLQGILHVTNGAVATSGDYRNYIEHEGSVYSHILDPRSGNAVRSDTASVTVSAPSCMDADGIATALFVMGSESGILWVEKQPDIEALILVREEDGEIIEKFSSGFKASTRYTSSLNP
jgi:thiamine biosynthesis lipoprotein